MPKIELDTTRANKAIIYFEIRMPLSSIDIVLKFIFVGDTNFHVIDISTPFFLCLKNMDTLGIYLNNIIH